MRTTRIREAGGGRVLEARCVALDLQAEKKEDVLGALIGLLERSGRIASRECFAEAVMRREKAGATGLMYGVAVPHASDASVTALSLAVLRTEHGIPWESMDGSMPRLFFMIAARPEDGDEKLRLMIRLAKLLCEEKAVAALMRCEDREAFMELLETVQQERVF